MKIKKHLILQRIKLISNLDIQKTLEICRQLGGEDGEEEGEEEEQFRNNAHMLFEADPYRHGSRIDLRGGGGGIK